VFVHPSPPQAPPSPAIWRGARTAVSQINNQFPNRQAARSINSPPTPQADHSRSTHTSPNKSQTERSASHCPCDPLASQLRQEQRCPDRHPALNRQVRRSDFVQRIGLSDMGLNGPHTQGSEKRCCPAPEAFWIGNEVEQSWPG